MMNIKISDEHAHIEKTDITSIEKILTDEIEVMKKATQLEYEDDRASLNLAFDNENVNKIKQIIHEKKQLHPEYIIVVGIGGSNLGTMAVQEAIQGKLSNQFEHSPKILYADTVDSDQISDIRQIMINALKKGKEVLINGVSKSGGTTETIANFQVLVDTLKTYRENHEQYIIITTDKESKFWHLGNDKGYTVLEIPKKVGGRFSVFSSVGLFPLGFIGIDIEKLLKGVRTMREHCLNHDINNNIAALTASYIYLHSLKEINIHDLFFFSTDFESIGKWYRQLMAESIGKEYDVKNEQVFNGTTPTVSIGSTDLHSMAQLYLGGPYDKFTAFIHIQKNKNQLNIKHDDSFASLVDVIQDRSMEEIMTAILKGSQAAFVKGNRPFIDIELVDKSEESIGQFLQYKMMEIIFLGALMNVNPFDQPNVEAYKIETKKILERH